MSKSVDTLKCGNHGGSGGTYPIYTHYKGNKYNPLNNAACPSNFSNANRSLVGVYPLRNRINRLIAAKSRACELSTGYLYRMKCLKTGYFQELLHTSYPATPCTDHKVTPPPDSCTQVLPMNSCTGPFHRRCLYAHLGYARCTHKFHQVTSTHKLPHPTTLGAAMHKPLTYPPTHELRRQFIYERKTGRLLDRNTRRSAVRMHDQGLMVRVYFRVTGSYHYCRARQIVWKLHTGADAPGKIRSNSHDPRCTRFDTFYISEYWKPKE